MHILGEKPTGVRPVQPTALPHPAPREQKSDFHKLTLYAVAENQLHLLRENSANEELRAVNLFNVTLSIII